MKLVQFWKDKTPALGLQTPQGIIDVQAEAARRGVSAPGDMAQAIALGDTGLSQLAPLAEGAQCFADSPLAPVVTQTGRILCIGLNYRQHAKECGLPLPPAPVPFCKFSNALAAHGDCLIVGRNADLILAEHRPLKLFVYADLESRLRRCRERSSDDERFTLRELERKLRQVDQHRARHHAMLSDLPWGSQEGYHLCVNTTGLSLKTLAPLVAEYARSWFSHQGTP